MPETQGKASNQEGAEMDSAAAEPSTNHTHKLQDNQPPPSTEEEEEGRSERSSPQDQQAGEGGNADCESPKGMYSTHLYLSY